MSWLVYLLITTDSKYTYCGATNDFENRFRQHCGEIANGARYTTNIVKAGHQWRPLVIITGFKTQREALQFELCQKQKMDKFRGANLPPAAKISISTIKKFKHVRLRKLTQSLLLERWTTKAIASALVPLKIYWYDLQEMPENWKDIMPPHLQEHCSYDWAASSLHVNVKKISP